MSSRSEQLSPGLFVVRPAAASANVADLARLEGKASVEPLASRMPGWVVRLNRPPRTAREGWRSLRRWLGDAFVVLPAIVDGAGRHRYPTGLLSLRFEDETGDDALREVAETYGLELVGRQKFTRHQALFRPAAGTDVFLPDISGRIAHDAQVEAVWFDAESAFNRT
jgi:hypothetical protein